MAKSAYVKLRSGWFSDRSASYLASGRPIALQSTGFERWLPTGCGLIDFTTLEEACAAVRAIESDYAAHSRRAREITCTFFDAPKVLALLVERADQ